MGLMLGARPARRLAGCSTSWGQPQYPRSPTLWFHAEGSKLWVHQQCSSPLWLLSWLLREDVHLGPPQQPFSFLSLLQ